MCDGDPRDGLFHVFMWTSTYLVVVYVCAPPLGFERGIQCWPARRLGVFFLGAVRSPTGRGGLGRNRTCTLSRFPRTMPDRLSMYRYTSRPWARVVG